MNSHQKVSVKPRKVMWSFRRIKKVSTPLDDRRNERKIRTDPIDHFRLELVSSQTWETIRSSRPNIATTTARDTTLLARTIPKFIPSTLAWLRSVTHFNEVLLLPKVQKCHSPNSFPFAKSQWPSQTEIDDRTTAIATHKIMRLLINVSKNDFLGLLWASNLCACTAMAVMLTPAARSEEETREKLCCAPGADNKVPLPAPSSEQEGPGRDSGGQQPACQHLAGARQAGCCC